MKCKSLSLSPSDLPSRSKHSSLPASIYAGVTQKRRAKATKTRPAKGARTTQGGVGYSCPIRDCSRATEPFASRQRLRRHFQQREAGLSPFYFLIIY